MRWIRTTALLALFGLVAVAAPARADDPPPPAPPPAPAPDADAARIAAAGHSLKWNWTPPGRNQRFGHAETLVHTSIDNVRRLVIDYPKYKDLAPSITTSKVVGHQPDGSTDLYIRMGVLNNTISFWNVTRFAPPRAVDGNEVIEGQMVPGKGNIDDSVVVWTLHPAGPDWTVLKFDVLLRPGLPAPQSLIDEQLRDSAMDAVNSVHDRAQGSKDVGPYSG